MTPHKNIPWSPHMVTKHLPNPNMHLSLYTVIDRKSRFEVHHSHIAQPPSTPAPSANATGLSSPVLSGTRVVAGDSSQQSVLSRDSSATRVSRFNVGTSQPPLEPHPNSTATPTADTPNATQSKRSRFQVSSVDGRPVDVVIGKISIILEDPC